MRSAGGTYATASDFMLHICLHRVQSCFRLVSTQGLCHMPGMACNMQKLSFRAR